MIKEKSGSCACAVLIVDGHIYIANVGDSRAIMSVYAYTYYINTNFRN